MNHEEALEIAKAQGEKLKETNAYISLGYAY